MENPRREIDSEPQKFRRAAPFGEEEGEIAEIKMRKEGGGEERKKRVRRRGRGKGMDQTRARVN